MFDREAWIRSESDRLGAVLGSTDPGARVPTCPDWRALDLLKHLTRVQGFWAAVIGDRLSEAGVEEFERTRPDLPDDPARLQELRRTATTQMLAALNGREPSEHAWSWFTADQSVDFTWRMQTHEATMHRVDAELTAGLPISSIATEVAAEGISHMLDVMWAWPPDEADRRVTGTVEFRATDTGQRWLANTIRWSGAAWGHKFTDHPGCVRADAGEPNASVSGTAQDLDLLVWTRADRNLTRAGDAGTLAELQAVLDAGVQ